MNLYVSNLSFQTDDDALRTLFEKFGTVSSAKVINDRDTGRSRGFGFVEMDSVEEANAAIKGLDNKEIGGRTMSVSVAREKSNRSGQGGRSGGGRW
jgi:RNA recognition motif-containing protein